MGKKAWPVLHLSTLAQFSSGGKEYSECYDEMKVLTENDFLKYKVSICRANYSANDVRCYIYHLISVRSVIFIEKS